MDLYSWEMSYFLGFKETNVHITLYHGDIIYSTRCRKQRSRVVKKLGFKYELWPQPMPAISLHCDSEATMSRAYNKVYNGKSRHISLRHEYVQELILDGVISIVYVRSSKNLADPLTKGLNRDTIRTTTIEMGLKPIFVSHQ